MCEINYRYMRISSCSNYLHVKITKWLLWQTTLPNTQALISLHSLRQIYVVIVFICKCTGVICKCKQTCLHPIGNAMKIKTEKPWLYISDSTANVNKNKCWLMWLTTIFFKIQWRIKEIIIIMYLYFGKRK